MIKYYIYFSPVFEYVLFCPTALYFFVFPVLRFLLRYPMTINIKYKIVRITSHHITSHTQDTLTIEPPMKYSKNMILLYREQMRNDNKIY